MKVSQAQEQGVSQTGTETLCLADYVLTAIILERLCCFLPPGLCTCRSLYLQCLSVFFFIYINLILLRPHFLQGALPTPTQAKLG